MQAGRRNAQAHAIDRGRDQTGGGLEASKRIGRERIGMRPGDNSNFPWALQRQPVPFGPGRGDGLVPDHRSNIDPVILVDRTTETAPESAGGTKRTAPEH